MVRSVEEFTPEPFLKLKQYNATITAVNEATMARIIAIANQKGGVGKTTTAINLGAYLSKAGRRVLIVDLDPQGNTTTGLGIDKNQLKSHIYNALIEEQPLDQIIQTVPYHGLEVLPSAPVLAAAEIELVNRSAREFQLKRVLEPQDYDYLLIDCPPSLGLLTINGLVAADSVIIPVQAEFYALEGLSQLLNTIKRVKQGLNPKLELLGVLVTMHNGRTTLSAQVHSEVKRHFANKVFETIIPRNVRLAEAPSYGQPISQYDRWSKGAKSYKQLAKEVIKRAD